MHASSNDVAIIRIRQPNRGNDGFETLNRCGRKGTIHEVSSSLELRTGQVWPSGEVIGDPLFVNQVRPDRAEEIRCCQGEKKVPDGRAD